MMAMQSQAPGTNMAPNAMLPLLFMDKKSNNEDLMFFMLMNQNQAHCNQPVTEAPTAEPENVVETVFRTWRVNADGSKTLVDESPGMPINGQ